MDTSQTALSYLHQQQEDLVWVAKEIWDHPEIALQEKFAADLLSKQLAEAGFTIEMEVGQMETAFIASWGSGTPIIGVLGEYDALPGLSQEVSATHTPIETAGPGHGCGHNLFGVASLGAAIAIKEAMEANGISGTVRFYGCPAEETLVGKVFMARAGVFDDLDAALAWHPSDTNIAAYSSSLAMNSFKVNFHGLSSHASGAPHLGRSALDGAQLMDIGVNYLREHVIQEARIHSVISHGGQAPNVVPAYAQIWYFVRAPKRHHVDEIYTRMLDIAKGAALMSGTTYDIDFITGCYDILPNQTLTDIMYQKMIEIGGIDFSPEEVAFAKELQATFPPNSVESAISGALKQAAEGTTIADIGEALHGGVLKHKISDYAFPASTEVGDVSHITPTGQIVTSCHPIGTPPHSWQITASSGMSIGFKGMLFAAQTMALTGLELLTNPEALAAAKAEFEMAKKDDPYVSPLPEGAVPH